MIVALASLLAALLLAVIAQRLQLRRAEHALSTSEASLRSSRSEAQALAGRLIDGQESERHRIARDLHDNVCQKLAMLCLEVDFLKIKGIAPPEMLKAVAHLSARARDIAGDVRQLSHDLHPPSLDLLGLAPSIDALCRDLSARCNVDIWFRARAVDHPLPPDVTRCLFRITQAALQNIVDHSGANAARVRLVMTKRDIRLQIVDNGDGFDVASKDGLGLGLVSMRERALFAGGRIAVRSSAGRGTRIVVGIPLAAPPKHLPGNLKKTVRTIVNEHRHVTGTRLHGACALALICALFGTPARAFAQTDKWEVAIAPLYFWVATTDGNLAVNGTRNIPVYMNFADAKEKLAGAFSFHGEARKGRWGAVGDIPAAARKVGSQSSCDMTSLTMVPGLITPGQPDAKAKLLTSFRAGEKTFKNHLDGYNFLPLLKGDVAAGPRHETFYFDDGANLNALRYNDWKVTFQFLEGNFFNGKRVSPNMPFVVNLRQDPFERFPSESMRYLGWMQDKLWAFMPAQVIVGQFLQSFREFPPSQKSGSFGIDQALQALQSGTK